MKIFETIPDYQAWRSSLGEKTQVGFVPTMGALHSGHAALMRQAKKENDLVVLSIYVNPTQFNQAEDFEKYPKTWDADLATAEAAGADAIFAPKNAQELYPDGYHYRVTEDQFSKELCGAFRPGHFDGVLTVVLKLFQIVRPNQAYFGEKDHQQMSLIEGMIRAFFLPVKLVPVKTVRETSGLALSSRNLRLSESEKKLAPTLHQIITRVKSLDEAKAELKELGFEVEYLIDRKDGDQTRRYVAAWLGKVRLIDNVER